MPIEYKETAVLPEPAVRELYADSNWSVYTRDMPRLMAAIGNSLKVISAWDGEILVGLVRAVGDGQTILYIQDILVLKAYRRRGIGTALLKGVLAACPDVRQKVLLTDDRPETREFYQANGFQACDKGETVAFARFD
ncbi:MAG: GNAT family N-acetyltransferase [Bacillota bacterium]|jgi:GNAT superfamily N-acetyltransferase